ncbi:hypothetical protein HHI36_023436 [Cryptolaemus montrouzieri]|uniref:Uncharacterized protein n=1 Tax=Cryptolaemus montrouzieri TaxID=559131 RepID=A0ABD2PH47_9CUCU
MSAPRKKLSEGENRKKSEDKFEEVNKSASKMRKWLYEAGPSSSSTDTSDAVSGISNNSCNLDTQVPTDQLKLQGSDDGMDGKQYYSSIFSQQGDNVQLASSDLLQSISKYEIIDEMEKSQINKGNF